MDSIAYTIGLPRLYDSDDTIRDRLVSWLESERSGYWLLILDNCDDVSAFQAAPHNNILEQPVAHSVNLPRNSRGKILITSRNINLALQLTETQESIIHVGSMSEVESTFLLERKLPYDPSHEVDGKTLIQALGYLPLAISQAAAFITSRTPNMTISKYLDLFQRNERNQTLLLIHDSGDLRRDPSLINAVATTWHISFDQIRAQYPSAADLLSRLSVLGQETIPMFLLSRDERVESELDEDLRVLQAYSLVAVQDEDNLEVHRLVQLITRAWLQLHAEVDQRKEEALCVLASKYPDTDYANWNTCEVLEPHVRIVLTYLSSSMHSRLQRAALSHNSGEYAFIRGNFELGTSRVREAVFIRTDLLGSDHPDSLASQHLLALIMKRQGRYIEAEQLEERVGEASSRILGQEHPNTLTSMANLASTYSEQGRWAEAEELHVRVMETQVRVLGQEHPDTLISAGNLALVLLNQGKYEAAEMMNKRVLEARKKVFGLEHPATLTSISQLGSVLESQGKYEEAEVMHREALEVYKRVLGYEHPDTLTSLDHLGLVLSRQGLYDEAELMHRQALEGRERKLGPEHPQTLSSVCHLAFISHHQQRDSDALQMYQHAYNGYVKALGAHHPITVACRHHHESMS